VGPIVGLEILEKRKKNLAPETGFLNAAICNVYPNNRIVYNTVMGAVLRLLGQLCKLSCQ